MTVRNLFMLFSIAILMISTGCVTILSSGGGLVRFEENIEMVTNCRYMGTVRGTSPAGMIDDLKKENALNDIRNIAARMGANTVVITSRDSMFDETVIHGKAYSCPLDE